MQLPGPRPRRTTYRHDVCIRRCPLNGAKQDIQDAERRLLRSRRGRRARGMRRCLQLGFELEELATTTQAAPRAPAAAPCSRSSPASRTPSPRTSTRSSRPRPRRCWAPPRCIYEPLLQANALKPGSYYNWLATGYSWSDGGKSITFTIRPGVKWSNGSALTAADVAFTYQMLKKYPDVNTTGLAIKSVSSSGNKVTINFASPQYANLQNIAAQVYIVPQSVWSKVGDPGKYLDADPVGSGPYTLATFGGQGFTLARQPELLGRQAGGGHGASSPPTRRPTRRCRRCRPISWTGVETSSPASSRCSSPAVTSTTCGSRPCRPTAWSQTSTSSRPTSSPCARRSAWPSTAPRSASRPRAAWSRRSSNASGLTLPVFQQYLSPAVASSTLPAHADVAAAKAVLKQAGYMMGSDGTVPHQVGPEAVDRHHQPVVVRRLRGR